MSDERAVWQGKTFKSGNSVALRLPKGLGFVEGDSIVIVPHGDGSFTCWKEAAELYMLMGLYGGFSAGFMADGRGDTEQAEYGWSAGPQGQAA